MVRFIADAKAQKVYVAVGYYCIHDDIRKALGKGSIESEWKKVPYNAGGESTLVGGRLTLDPVEYNSNGGETLERLKTTIEYMSKDIIKPSSIKNIGDFVTERKPFIEAVFNLNWSFVDRYISGFTTFMNQEKEIYETYIKKFSKTIGQK